MTKGERRMRKSPRLGSPASKMGRICRPHFYDVLFFFFPVAAPSILLHPSRPPLPPPLNTPLVPLTSSSRRHGVFLGPLLTPPDTGRGQPVENRNRDGEPRRANGRPPASSSNLLRSMDLHALLPHCNYGFLVPLPCSLDRDDTVPSTDSS
jgi:hypothetical protein